MTDTSDNSIFVAVERTIYLCQHSLGKRLFEWSFPRQSGVTQYFSDRIVNDICMGRHIAIFGHNVDNTNEIRERVDRDIHLQARDLSVNNRRELRLEAGGQAFFFTVNESNPSWIHNIRGRSLDRVYLDNWIHTTTPRDRQEFKESVIPTIVTKDGYVLALNTTEG